jgi:hypothetical protein
MIDKDDNTEDNTIFFFKNDVAVMWANEISYKNYFR